MQPFRIPNPFHVKPSGFRESQPANEAFRNLDSHLTQRVRQQLFRFYHLNTFRNNITYYNFRKNLLHAQGGVSTRSQSKNPSNSARVDNQPPAPQDEKPTRAPKRSPGTTIELNHLLNRQLVAYNDASGLAFVLIKKELKRHYKFSIQDILYEYEISILHRNKLTPSILENTLNQALANTIKLLQTGYKKQEHEYSQFFVVMKDHADVQKRSNGQLSNQQVHVYNSGHYYLFQDAQKVANEILIQISAYFQSNKEFELDKGFYLSFTVVHATHEKHRQSKTTYVAPKKVGSKPGIMNRFNLKSNRKNFLEFPPLFQNKNLCLPAALLYAKMRAHYYQYLYYCELAKTDDSISTLFLEELNTNIYKICFLKVNNLHGKNSQYCQSVFDNLITNFLEKIGLNHNNGFDYTVDGHLMADFLHVQYYVYSRIGNRKIYQYPQERDVSRPPVFLYYEDYNNQPMGHINLILKLTFFNHFYYCPFCNKRVLHNQALHYCNNACKACRFYK